MASCSCAVHYRGDWCARSRHQVLTTQVSALLNQLTASASPSSLSGLGGLEEHEALGHASSARPSRCSRACPADVLSQLTQVSSQSFIVDGSSTRTTLYWVLQFAQVMILSSFMI